MYYPIYYPIFIEKGASSAPSAPNPEVVIYIVVGWLAAALIALVIHIWIMRR